MTIKEYEVKRCSQLIEEDMNYKDDFAIDEYFVYNYPKYKKEQEQCQRNYLKKVIN